MLFGGSNPCPSPSPLCPICGSEPETPEHLLFFCPWSAAVWLSSALSCKVGRLDVRRVDLWLFEVLCESDALDDRAQSLVAFLCWFIWKGRCLFVFENKPLDPILTKRLAEKACDEYFSTVSKGAKPCEPGSSCQTSQSGAGIGVLFRNHLGVVLDGCCLTVDASSSLMVEALAVRHAVLALSDLKWDGVCIESDCAALVRAISSGLPVGDWACDTIVEDIRVLSRNFRRISFSWVNRQCNLAADWLAKAAVWRMCPSGWVSSPPSSLASLLALDACGIRSGVG
ncbi:reverse transcriptase [Senna tora]|uniref:Reverse transcriptase n=1 Tax=Senna tora TaxID=362788 RepID=A0A834W0F9_9FABA|nr:reverse transcriptase [Senna tora]